MLMHHSICNNFETIIISKINIVPYVENTLYMYKFFCFHYSTFIHYNVFHCDGLNAENLLKNYRFV